MTATVVAVTDVSDVALSVSAVVVTRGDRLCTVLFASLFLSTASVANTHKHRYNHWLARLLSFKRPLLSVDVNVCMSATLMLNISETKRFRCLCPIGTYRKVRTARRLVTSSMTSRDSILVMSIHWKSSRLETSTRINYPCGKTALKNQLIRLRTLGDEAFGVTLYPKWKLPIIGTVAVRRGESGPLKA